MAIHGKTFVAELLYTYNARAEANGPAGQVLT